MYTLKDVYKTFPSGCTEDYKILRAFEMGKQASEKRIAELTDELKALRESIKDYGAGCYENGLRNGRRKLEAQIEKMKCCGNCRFSESDKLNGTFCHREGCFVVASGEKCKLWEN